MIKTVLATITFVWIIYKIDIDGKKLHLIDNAVENNENVPDEEQTKWYIRHIRYDLYGIKMLLLLLVLIEFLSIIISLEW